MSKSMHARKPKVHVRTVSHIDPFADRVVTFTVSVRDMLKKDADREYEEMCHGNYGPRPYPAKHQAIQEGLFDLMDVQDEQAIADDGIVTQERGYWGTYTTETPKPRKVAVVMDMTAQAKQHRRQHIEREMAKGVLFPDLDPYTLEPIRSRGPKAEVSNLRPSRRRYF